MIRIVRDRCGYRGYVCDRTGLEPTTRFAATVMTCDPATGRTTFDDETAAMIDNYLDIPEAVAGMTMRETGVPDLSDAFTAPEETCATDFLVFRGDGDARPAAMVDALSILASRGKDRYRNVDRDDIADVSDSAALSSRLICFGEDDDMMSPALLEPMLAVDMPPIGLSGLPSVDMALDGVMLSLTMLTAWRLEITERVNRLALAVAHIYAMRALIDAWMQDATCDCFRIEKSSGKALRWGSTGGSGPTYMVNGCTARINGVGVTVSSINFTAGGSPGDETNVYLRVSMASRNVSANLTTVSGSAPTGDDNTVYIHIGGVKCVGTGSANLNYRLWRIEQTMCNVDVDLIRPVGGSGSGGNGLIFRARTRTETGEAVPSGSGNAGIYRALDTSTCP